MPTTEILSGIKMTEVKYKCANCGAEDTARLFPHEAVPPVLNCWKCHAGMGHPDIGECLARRIGMFPVGSEDLSRRNRH